MLRRVILSTWSVWGIAVSTGHLERFNPEPEPEASSKLKDTVASFVSKMGIKANYSVSSTTEGSQVRNPTNISWFTPKILIDETDCDFVIAHELAHIKHNHGLKSIIVPFVLTPLALSLSLVHSRRWLTGTVLCATQVIQFGLGMRHERQADETAIRYTNTEGLYDAIRFFKLHSEGIMDYRAALPKYLRPLISERGEVIYDVHPSDMSRIRNFETVIRKRGDDRKPLEISVYDESTREYTTFVDTEFRHLVAESNKKHILGNIRKIVYIPHDNTLLVWGQGDTPYMYHVDRSLDNRDIAKYIVNHPRFIMGVCKKDPNVETVKSPLDAHRVWWFSEESIYDQLMDTKIVVFVILDTRPGRNS